MLLVGPLGVLMATIGDDTLVGPLVTVMNILLADPLDVMVMPFQLHLGPVGCCDHFILVDFLVQ